VVVLVLAVLLLPGGAAVTLGLVKLTEERRKVRLALRAAARRHGIDPDIMDALGRVESGWNLRAVNLSGPDGARGGAWGPTQITARTAAAHGYSGPMSAFTTDPDLAAEWSARIMAARPGGPPRTVEDAAAWWNAGRASFASLPAGHITREDYAPKARAALAQVKASPAPEAAA
jgi:soluble lytic murein transglycosylase-like protein